MPWSAGKQPVLSQPASDQLRKVRERGFELIETLAHAIHAAHRSEHKTPKLAAVTSIVVGFFLAPMLIGIPLVFYGIYKLCD